MDGAHLTGALPQPDPLPPPLPEAQDVDYPGVLRLEVDATDTERGVFWTRLSIPVAQPGPMVLLYPKWLPGYHSPAASIELLAGLKMAASGKALAWRRDPVEVTAFHIDVPDGADSVEVELQYLSPTAPSQGPVTSTPLMCLLSWARVALYPAGHFARRITVQASVTLPPDWTAACALDIDRQQGARIDYRPAPLDILVDSPLMAGRFARRIGLDDDVHLNLFGETAANLEATPGQIAPHRALIVQADRLFGARHFRRYEFLAALSDELDANGVEHHCACEICTTTGYFSQWEHNAPRRDVFAHEYVHSWNGKHRRGADSWTPAFDQPIRNSLMWVYEGLTQFYGQVLAVRCGLWTAPQLRDALAVTAATLSRRPGGRWRPMSDTTRDPIIASRSPLPWTSWQRSEDYYSEGQLMWLDIDTLIRERTGEARTLDDFARAFFGGDGGRADTVLYRAADVVAALNGVVAHDWAGLIEQWLENRQDGTFLSGLERGGYRLAFGDAPTDFAVATDALNSVIDHRFSIGLRLNSGGVIQEVVWESPAFDGGLTAGACVLAVNGAAFSAAALAAAIAETAKGQPLDLMVKRHSHVRSVRLAYDGGLRYPRLEPIEGARRRLDDLLAPLPQPPP